MAFPHDFDFVPGGFERLYLFSMILVHVLYNATAQSRMRFGPLGKRDGAHVPKTPIEFIEGFVHVVITVEGVLTICQGVPNSDYNLHKSRDPSCQLSKLSRCHDTSVYTPLKIECHLIFTSLRSMSLKGETNKSSFICGDHSDFCSCI